MEEPTITAVIIDLYPVIYRYMQCSDLYTIYRVCSLKQLITKILSVTDDELDTLVDIIVVDIYGYNTTMYDVLRIEAFLHDLIDALERHLYMNSGVLPVSELILDEWVDQTTVIMRKE